MKNNSLLKIFIRWIIILILIVLVFILKKELIYSAFEEIKNLNLNTILICLVLSMGYFIFDGLINTQTSKCSIWFGQKCSFYCAFYKLATLGAGAGLAEVYYLTGINIPASKGTGIMMIQYAMHKLLVTLMGLTFFIILSIHGDLTAKKYVLFILIGSIISILICATLILIAASQKFSKLMIRLANFLLKRWPEKAQNLEEKIRTFTENGQDLIHSKKNILLTGLFNIFKLLCWYSIPAVIFALQGGGNYFHDVAYMGLALMLTGVMIAPAGVGTLEYVFTLFFTSQYGALATAAVILYRFFTMIPPFIVGIPFVLSGRKKEIKKIPED